MRYQEQAPPPRLALWVECGWRSAAPVDGGDAVIMPDGCVDLIYSRADGLRAVGAMTQAHSVPLAAGEEIAGVRLRPGMAQALLGLPIMDLTEITLPLESLAVAGAGALRQRLEAAPAAAWLDIVFSHLFARRDRPSGVERALQHLAATAGNADVDRLASQSGLSSRHFRRRCLEASGLGPKHLARILRFRRVWRLATATQPRWADLALEAGYFDQAHLIRDFREFTGQSPMAVLSKRRADWAASLEA